MIAQLQSMFMSWNIGGFASILYYHMLSKNVLSTVVLEARSHQYKYIGVVTVLLFLVLNVLINMDRMFLSEQEEHPVHICADQEEEAHNYNLCCTPI